MLEKVISIGNVGRFLNSAGQPNPRLARHTLLFAPNGYGKTTICAILRSLERNNPDYILGRRSLGTTGPQVVSLLWNGAPRAFQNDAWPGPEPKLSIFDSTYVAENVHSGDIVDVENRRNLYRVMVGRSGVGLAREEQRLAEESRAIQQRLTAAERAVTAISGGISVRDFHAIAPDSEIDEKLESARAALSAQQQAAGILAKAKLVPIVAPEVPVESLAVLAETIAGLDPEAVHRVRAHLEHVGLGPDGEAWLADGSTKLGGDDCIFCGRDGVTALPLIQAYQTVFSESYDGLWRRVQTEREGIIRLLGDGAFGELRATAINNSALAEFWQQHCSTPELPKLSDLRELYSAALNAADSSSDEKLGNPLAKLSLGSDDPFLSIITDIRDRISIYNDAVAVTNAAIDVVKSRLSTTNENEARAALAQLEAVLRRHGPEGVSACEAWSREFQAKKANTDSKTETRRLLEEHCARVLNPYQTRINYFLGIFNAGFQIVGVSHGYPGGIATSSYALLINGNSIALGDARTAESQPSFKNTLSAGDRTTLALAFFLAELEREIDLASRVVVFDDPFNSQDSYRRRNTIFEIMAVAASGAQILVLSHDASFLKAVWQKSPPAERASLQIVFHPSVGSKILPFDIDDACQGRSQREVDDLIAFRNANVGEMRDIIKKLRVVLETHFRESYPGSFDPDDNLGGILGKTRAGGAEHPAAPWYDEVNRINDYTQEYHHGEDPRGATEPPLDRDELRGFVSQTLRIANVVVG